MSYRAQPLPDQQGRFVAPSAPITPDQLAAAREAADERTRQAIADRQAKEAAARAERERIAAEQGAAELADFEARARAAFLGNGGTAAEFRDAWPELKRRHLTERTLEGLSARERMIEQAKAELRASGRYERL